MKNNLRGKIREFIASEEGRVGVKGPLTLGVATGSILLAEAIIGNPVEAKTCNNHAECGQFGHCATRCFGPPRQWHGDMHKGVCVTSPMRFPHEPRRSH